jgi:hypothetical protein
MFLWLIITQYSIYIYSLYLNPVKSEFNLVTVDFFIQNRCLNDPTVELNEKLSKKNISMLLETFMYKKQEVLMKEEYHKE